MNDVYHEEFDARRLMYIIDNFEQFKLKPEVKERCIDYLSGSIVDNDGVGHIDVRYFRNNNKGRMFAVGGVSLQSLKRCIRHTIAVKHYIDIDMVNAHPVILAHICKSLGIKCVILKKYITMREELILSISAKYGLNRSNVKKLFLKMMNGGMSFRDEFNKIAKKQCKYRTFVNRFWDEVCDIHVKINKVYLVDSSKHKAMLSAKYKDDELGKKKKNNHEASFTNTLICDMENKVLGDVMNITGLNQHDFVLCFDGFMVPINSMIDIQLVNNYSSKYGITFVDKPMDEVMVLPELDTVGIHHIREYISKNNNKYLAVSDFVKMADTSDTELLRLIKSVIVRDGDTGTYLYKSRTVEPANDTHTQSRRVYKWNRATGSHFKTQILGGYSYKRKGKGDTTIDILLSDFVESNLASVQKDDSLFYPFVDGISPPLDRCVHNTFTSFKHHYNPNFKMDDVGKAGVDRFLEYLKHSICSNREYVFDYMVKYIAHLFRYPRIKTNIHLVIKGDQGTGKSLFAELLECVYYGEYLKYMTIDQLTDKFNDQLINALMIVINEAKIDNAKQINKLKTLITESSHMVEAKYQNQMKVNLYGNYISTSNHYKAVKACGDDRRHVILTSNSTIPAKYKDSDDYFGGLSTMIKSSSHVQCALFHYFVMMDTKGFRPHINIINTDEKNELKMLGMPMSLVHIIHVVAGCRGCLKADTFIPSQYLYDDYCTFNTEKYKASHNNYFLELKQNLKMIICRRLYEGERRTVIGIPKYKTVESLCGSYLRIDNFNIKKYLNDDIEDDAVGDDIGNYIDDIDD